MNHSMQKKSTILMIGKQHAGKKTLAEHVEPAFVSETQGPFTILKNNHTQWIIPHKPLNPETTELLISLGKKNNALQPVQSILVVIDLPTLIDPAERAEEIKTLNETLQFIKAREKIDINLFITHCDRLLGFKEYFSNLDKGARQKIFGTQGSQDFTNLLKELNAQVISRLHHETLSERRSLIQLFPAEFEKLTEILTEFKHQLFSDGNMTLHNIYFTSSQQKGKSIDLLGTREAQINPIITDRPYFITEAIEQILKEAKTNQLAAKRLDKKRWAILPICLIIITAFVMTWHLSYVNTERVLNRIELGLAQNPMTGTQEPAWQSRLFLLNQTLIDLDNPELKYSRLIGFSQTHALKQKLTFLYEQQLSREFLPYVSNIVSNTITENLQGDPLALYNALKVYLMLTHHQYYDQHTILNWFAVYWQNLYPNHPGQTATLLIQLNHLLNLKNQPWVYRPALIDTAQKVLAQLPLADMVFLELQGVYRNQTESLSNMLENSDNLDLSQAIIPSLFSPSHFKKIYDEEIPTLVMNFKQGNWVIGQPALAMNHNLAPEALISSVRLLYLQKLSENWQTVIPKINLKKPLHFSDVENLINEMTNPQSSLMELLEFSCVNARSDKQSKPNLSLQQVTEFLQQKGPYLQAKAALDNLSAYLTATIKSNDVSKASYNAAITILNNPNQKNPINALLKLNLAPPIQNWLNTIAEGSWSALLDQSKIYLNNTWTRIVLPTYSSTIADRYPLNPKALRMIGLKDFTNFIGPDGTIDVFFNYYLKPFVNMRTNYWTWQNMYGAAMPMPQSVLDVFMRASIIQQMFFTDNHHKMFFTFTLTPLSRSKNIKNVTLDFGGVVQHDTDFLNHPSMLVTWPAPNPESVSMHIVLSHGKPINEKTTGPWALFQLLQKGTLTMQQNPQKFILSFKWGNTTLSYLLTANHRVNPFIPQVLSQFACPDSL